MSYGFISRREDHLHEQTRREDKKDSDVEEEDDVEDIENDSQEEDLSQDEEEEGANSQSEDQSQSQEEGSPRGGDTKTRRRRARKAD